MIQLVSDANFLFTHRCLIVHHHHAQSFLRRHTKSLSSGFRTVPNPPCQCKPARKRLKTRKFVRGSQCSTADGVRELITSVLLELVLLQLGGLLLFGFLWCLMPRLLLSLAGLLSMKKIVEEVSNARMRVDGGDDTCRRDARNQDCRFETNETLHTTR